MTDNNEGIRCEICGCAHECSNCFPGTEPGRSEKYWHDLADERSAEIVKLDARIVELEAENHSLRCCGNCDAAFCGKNHVLDDDRIQYAPYDDKIIVNSPKIVSHHMADWCIENGYEEWHRK